MRHQVPYPIGEHDLKVSPLQRCTTTLCLLEDNCGVRLSRDEDMLRRIFATESKLTPGLGLSDEDEGR